MHSIKLDITFDTNEISPTHNNEKPKLHHKIELGVGIKVSRPIYAAHSISRRSKILSDIEYSDNNEISIIRRSVCLFIIAQPNCTRADQNYRRRTIGMYGLLVHSALGEAGALYLPAIIRPKHQRFDIACSPVTPAYACTNTNTITRLRACVYPLGMGMIASNFARLRFGVWHYPHLYICRLWVVEIRVLASELCRSWFLETYNKCTVRRAGTERKSNSQLKLVQPHAERIITRPASGS